jgi:hypothetical protein
MLRGAGIRAENGETMTPPIFILCRNGDVGTFTSVSDAEDAVESPDVESGEYVGGFDATGTRLAIEVTNPDRRGSRLLFSMRSLMPVRIRPVSEPNAGADELKSLLASKLADASPDRGLPVLVQRALAAAEQGRAVAVKRFRKWVLVCIGALLAVALLVLLAK